MRNLVGRYMADGSTGEVVMASGGGHIFVSPCDGRGIVYRTVDGVQFEEFWRTGEPRVSALGFFADALFVGTEPEGKILMHNFSTGNRFHVVTTGDYGVGGFVALGARLFAGTFPSGEVLSFDGQDWTSEYVSFFSVSDMVAYKSEVYVFHSDAPFILKGKGKGTWGFIKDGDQTFSVSRLIRVRTSQSDLASQPFSETGISHAVALGEKLFFAGATTSNLYAYDGKAFSVACQFSGGPVSAMTVSESQVFAASGDSVFIYEDETQQETAQEAAGTT